MAELDSNTAECFVFTFKEGLLSSVAHDLRIKVTRFSLKVEPGARIPVDARFDARSLVVDAVMRDGREAKGVLSPRDLDKIQRTIREEVLHSDRYPEITFRSDGLVVNGDRAVIKGTLTLLGRSRTIAIDAKKEGDRWVTEVDLHQPDYGIKPYSAMLGALKIKPDVRVRISLPADRVPVEGAS